MGQILKLLVYTYNVLRHELQVWSSSVGWASLYSAASELTLYFHGIFTERNRYRETYFLWFNLALKIKIRKNTHIFCNSSQQQGKMHTLRVLLKLNLMCLCLKS